MAKPAKTKSVPGVIRRHYLGVLVEFLNLNFREVKKETLSVDLQIVLEFNRREDDDALTNLESVQAELIADLGPFTGVPAERFKTSDKINLTGQTYTQLRALVDKLNSMTMAVRFQILPGERDLVYDAYKLKPRARRPASVSPMQRWEKIEIRIKNPSLKLKNEEQGVFSRGLGAWIVKPDFQPTTYSSRGHFYAIVAESLQQGDLSKLRRCPYCRMFFIARDPRRIYCPSHTRAFHDQPKMVALRKGRELKDV